MAARRFASYCRRSRAHWPSDPWVRSSNLCEEAAFDLHDTTPSRATNLFSMVLCTDTTERMFLAGLDTALDRIGRIHWSIDDRAVTISESHALCFLPFVSSRFCELIRVLSTRVQLQTGSALLVEHLLRLVQHSAQDVQVILSRRRIPKDRMGWKQSPVSRFIYRSNLRSASTKSSLFWKITLDKANWSSASRWISPSRGSQTGRYSWRRKETAWTDEAGGTYLMSFCSCSSSLRRFSFRMRCSYIDPDEVTLENAVHARRIIADVTYNIRESSSRHLRMACSFLSQLSRVMSMIVRMWV